MFDNPEAEQRAFTFGKKARLLTRKALAQALNLHPQTLVTWERDGMPVAMRGKRGLASLYNPMDVVKWRAERDASNGGAESFSLASDRARLARAHAEKVERENRVRAGELVELERVAREGQAFVKGWSAHVRALPKRLRALGIISADQEPNVALVCRQLLEQIAGWKTLADCEHSAAEAEALIESAG